jgi:6 kDa early secretory antigenic target
MDEIRVTFGEIAAGQQSVTSTSQQIGQQLDDLKAFLAPLVAEWTGEAAQNYQAQQHEIDTAWRDLNQVLAQIGVLLGQANDNYQATEARNAARYT